MSTVDGVAGRPDPPHRIHLSHEQAALSLLFERGRLTRPELVAATGMSKPTASEVTRRLVDAGLVITVGRTTGGVGPRADVYAVAPDASAVAVVSVREPDGLAVAVVDLAGEERHGGESTVDFDRDDPVDALVAAVNRARERAGVPEAALRRLWLAVPGSYDPVTDTVRNIDVPGFTAPDFARRLRAAFEPVVHIDNDVNLAALAERATAADAGFVLLWWGESGIGMGVDVDGGLLRGTRGAAGEIGYLPVTPGRGCRSTLQDVAGGPAVLRLARERGHDHAQAYEAVAAAVSAGDVALVDEIAERIVVGLAAVVTVLDPSAVVLSGEMGRAGGEVLAVAVARALANVGFVVPVRPSRAEGDPVLRGGVRAGLAALRADTLAGLVPGGANGRRAPTRETRESGDREIDHERAARADEGRR